MHEQCAIQLQFSRGRKYRSFVHQQRSCMSNECEAGSFRKCKHQSSSEAVGRARRWSATRMRSWRKPACA
eukprot:7002675-Lingulodinium_polyedra.AAC.1